MASQKPFQVPKCITHGTLCLRKLPRTMQASRFLTASRSRHFTISHTRTAISASEINFSDNSNLPPPSTRFARVVPASPSYFTGKPGFTDDLLNLEALLRKHEILPTIPGAQAPRIAWKTLSQYRVTVGEPVKASKYHKIVEVLRRLNRIHPGLMPPEVPTAMERYKRAINPYDNVRRPQEVDEFGRGFGVGRRKASTARAYLVEGEGEVLVNGKPLHQAFGRIHDRESAIWALKATGRIDKYNVWAVVEGGGTTGQAQSNTLSVAFFWDAANDSIKAGCVTRDPRRVERKKPGKLKARKMPAWVKR